jgi:Tfp pilus assembly protein PilO
MKRIRYTVYVFSGIFILGLIFMVFAFSHSSIKKFSRGNVRTEIQKLRTMETEFLQLKRAYRDWQQVEKAFDRFKSDYLFPFSTFSEFRSRFESQLKSNRLNISGLGYDIKNVTRKIVRVSIGFEAAGRYQNLKKMVYDINQMKQIIFIEGLNLAKSPIGVKADVNMEVYFVR